MAHETQYYYDNIVHPCKAIHVICPSQSLVMVSNTQFRFSTVKIINNSRYCNHHVLITVKFYLQFQMIAK